MTKKKIVSSAGKKTSYDDFLKSVKLYAVVLEEMNAKLERKTYWKHIKDEGELKRTIGANYVVEDLANDHFDIIAAYDLTIQHDPSTTDLLAIKCVFSAHFHAAPDCSTELADKFANSEAKLIFWPYLRTFVSDMTGRLHIPPITVPITLE